MRLPAEEQPAVNSQHVPQGRQGEGGVRGVGWCLGYRHAPRLNLWESGPCSMVRHEILNGILERSKPPRKIKHNRHHLATCTIYRAYRILVILVTIMLDLNWQKMGRVKRYTLPSKVKRLAGIWLGFGWRRCKYCWLLVAGGPKSYRPIPTPDSWSDSEQICKYGNKKVYVC
jgi:hypothetical protein